MLRFWNTTDRVEWLVSDDVEHAAGLVRRDDRGRLTLARGSRWTCSISDEVFSTTVLRS